MPMQWVPDYGPQQQLDPIAQMERTRAFLKFLEDEQKAKDKEKKEKEEKDKKFKPPQFSVLQVFLMLSTFGPFVGLAGGYALVKLTVQFMNATKELLAIVPH